MKIRKKDIKKGFKFVWYAYTEGYGGLYEVICYRRDLSEIYCYKPTGSRSTIKEGGELARFDERIINNDDFLIYRK